MTDFKTILEIGQSVLTSIAILVGGYWALLIYLRQRENHPHIEFSADVVFQKKIGDWWIIELVAFVENKGKIRHQMSDIEFILNSIEQGGTIELTEEFRNQVSFSKIVLRNSFLPKGKKHFFVEPGVRSKYSFVARVAATDQVVLFHTWFHYMDGGRVHVAEATKAVPQ